MDSKLITLQTTPTPFFPPPPYSFFKIFFKNYTASVLRVVKYVSVSEMDHSYWARSHQGTRSKANLGCAKTARASRDFVVWIVAYTPWPRFDLCYLRDLSSWIFLGNGPEALRPETPFGPRPNLPRIVSTINSVINLFYAVEQWYTSFIKPINFSVHQSSGRVLRSRN